MPGVVRGQAATAHASRYLQQLCKHWSHKYEASFDAARGRVLLPGGPLELEAGPEGLHLALTPNEGSDVARSRTVVEEHLNRFAHREAPLHFEWREEQS